MRLWKVFRGILLMAFFLLFCQVGRYVVVMQSGTAGVCNDFGAFSLALPRWLLVFLAGAIVCALGVQWWREQEGLPGEWAWLILMAGGMSNLWERVSTGCIEDYLDLPFLPAFNTADMMLTLGVIGIIWNLFLRHGRRQN